MQTRFLTGLMALFSMMLFASNAYAEICLPIIGCFGGDGGGATSAAPEIDATGGLSAMALLLGVFAIYRSRGARKD